MALQPEDPSHKSYVEQLLEDLIGQQKITNYLLGQIVGIDTSEEEALDDEDL